MSTLYTNKIAHNTASNNSVTISGSNFIIQGTLYTSGSITASGDISSSGTITATKYLSPLNVLEIEGNQIELDSAGQIRIDSAGSSTVFSTNGSNTVTINNTSGNITASGDINTHGTIVSNGFGNPTTIVTNTTIPAGYTMVLFTSRYNPSITINSGINYTVSSLADVSILDPSKLNF